MRESEERLARVTYSAMDAIVTFDGGLKIELFNEAAEKIFRCKADHAIGASLSRFLTESFRSTLESSMRAAAGGDQTHPYVFVSGGLTARRGDGAEFPVEAPISYVEVAGRPLYTLILRHIDERRRAENELQQLSLQNEYLQEEIKETHNFEESCDAALRWRRCSKRSDWSQAIDSSVLILGETGTGKEPHQPRRAFQQCSARNAR